MVIQKLEKEDTEVYHRLGFEDTDKELTVTGIRFTLMIYSI